MTDKRPFGFFVHHQGRGHAKRCMAIINALDDRPITVFSAEVEPFRERPDARVTIVELENAIGRPSATRALHEQVTPGIMHCVPMGCAPLTSNAAAMVRFFEQDRPGLFVVDVSAEWAILSRLCSVPAVSMRLHGARADDGHIGAWQSSVELLAPFDASLEQPDYPAWARTKTYYSGGLCTTDGAVPTRHDARQRLELPLEREIIVTLSGGGGTGANYASLTMGARARPDALWLAIGPLHREGHETDFFNLHDLGWVERPLDYLAAADLVIASAGDNTVHEIAQVGRPFLCIPEWRYFDEQTVKADALSRLGAAYVRQQWPASHDQWLAALAATRALEVERLKRLYEPDAGVRLAERLIALDRRLWLRESAEADRPRTTRELALVR